MSLHQHVVLRDTIGQISREIGTEVRTRSVREEIHGGFVTIRPARNHRKSASVVPFAEIEKRRVAAKLSINALCAAAGITPETYHRTKAGSNPNPFVSTLIKLAEAVAEARRRRSAKRGVEAVFLFVFERVCEKANYTYETVAQTDFAVQRPLNKEWRAHAYLRRLAMYITVTELDQRPTELAQALGLSRQAVHQAVEYVAARRRDEVAKLLDQVLELMEPYQ